VTLVKIKGGR